jgi:DNA segregation ATPase FtsK/SpoIIIE, S-DNA-T family
MKLLGPTRFHRLNEATALVFLLAGLFLSLSLVSYHPQDPSWNVVSGVAKPLNLTGFAGSYVSDFCLQLLGIAAFGLPLLMWLLAFKWVRSSPIEAAPVKVTGGVLLLLSLGTALSFNHGWHPFTGTFAAGGLIGTLAADYLLQALNFWGTVLLTASGLIIAVYLISSFSMAKLAGWLEWPATRLQSMLESFRARWDLWRTQRSDAARARALEKSKKPKRMKAPTPEPMLREVDLREFEEPVAEEEIPIRTLEEEEPVAAAPAPSPAPVLVEKHVALETSPVTEFKLRRHQTAVKAPEHYDLPKTDLLNEIPAKNPFDSVELKETAGLIKSKFEEFNVHGSVVQINPGPVVTTFEFKPEAGIKYNRITTLSEDLCLGLQAESVLIERIPGKPTVGIEVPNTRRAVISLRQILESEEFSSSASKMTICLGKDISGRIKVAALETMPHLLIAGSTGSGKSVMLNTLIMSVLYKATPDEVRMILVDPKRLEMGLYEGIPHLLTPVITDPKKATNALRNAVLEMERRLKLLAAQGVRNIDQYNKKVRLLREKPRSLFEDDEVTEAELKPLPFILIIIDELADLMMLERGGVEEAVTRLAQMARAVGMHLVLATQRPSVDVITGLIKANFPSRISFRVATRVDSRTVLDVMGAEHLLGKGDMLFLPPGSSRLIRVHGAFVTEGETNVVVEFWKRQARPEYDETFLLAPPNEDDADAEPGEFDGDQDPMYQDAVRVVLEMGKASTSTLQRRLRLGYGRAARILDMMQREGIIGPPDGSKPRDVLKRPDWLTEVESQMR